MLQLKRFTKLAQKGIHRLPDDRGYLRKAPYHFGWDWGPTVPTSGIWKSVYLKKIEPIEIEDVYIRQIELTKVKARLQAEVSIYTEKSEIVFLQAKLCRWKKCKSNIYT